MYVTATLYLMCVKFHLFTYHETVRFHHLLMYFQSWPHLPSDLTFLQADILCLFQQDQRRQVGHLDAWPRVPSGTAMEMMDGQNAMNLFGLVERFGRKQQRDIECLRFQTTTMFPLMRLFFVSCIQNQISCDSVQSIEWYYPKRLFVWDIHAYWYSLIEQTGGYHTVI